MSKNRGFTLVELIAVMAALSVFMGISVVLLVQIFDFQRNNDEYSEQFRSVNRLADAFRNDVHEFGKPEISADGASLQWKTETGKVDYVTEDGDFPEQKITVRTEWKDGKSLRRESYRLPEHAVLRFVPGKDKDDGLVALSLWTTPPGTEPPKPETLNPFDRTLPKPLEQRVDPRYAGNWRTIVARY